MTRKEFLANSTAALAAAPSLPAAQRTGGARPKNVLFLLSDQHQPLALSLLGNQHARTPNIDSLARTGVRFANAYCTNQAF